CADPCRHAAGAAAGELLGEDGVVQVVAPLTAVLLRVLEAEEAELRHPVEHLVREPARVLPLLGVGAQLVRDPAPDRLAQLLVLLAERRQWAARRGAGQPLAAQRCVDSHSTTSAALRSGGKTG